MKSDHPSPSHFDVWHEVRWWSGYADSVLKSDCASLLHFKYRMYRTQIYSGVGTPFRLPPIVHSSCYWRVPCTTPGRPYPISISTAWGVVKSDSVYASKPRGRGGQAWLRGVVYLHFISTYLPFSMYHPKCGVCCSYFQELLSNPKWRFPPNCTACEAHVLQGNSQVHLSGTCAFIAICFVALRPRDRRALAVDTNPGHPATRPSTNSVYTARPPTNSVYMYGVQKTNQATESRPVNSLDLPQTNTARPATKHVVSGRGMGLLAMMSKPISPGRLAVQGLQTSSFVNGSVVPTSSLGNSSGFPASSFGNTSIVATSSLGSSPDVSTNSLGNSSGFPAGSFGNTSGMPTSSGFLTAMDKSSSCEFAKDTGCAPATPGQVYNHARSGFFSSQFSAQEALSRSRASSDGLPAKTPDSAREISRDVTTASATINRHSVESSHDVPARGAGATNPRDPREDIPQQAPHTSGLGGVGMGVKSSHSPGRGVGRARLMAEARKNNFGRICGAYRSAGTVSISIRGLDISDVYGILYLVGSVTLLLKRSRLAPL